LPVPEMKHMATGGIVAFSGKGDSLVTDMYGYGYQAPDAATQARLQARADATRFTTDNPVDPVQILAAKQASGVPLTLAEQTKLRAARDATPLSGMPSVSSVRAADNAMQPSTPSLPARPGEKSAAAQMAATGADNKTAAPTASSNSPQTGMPNAAATYADMMKQLPPTVVPQEYSDIEKLQVEQANKGLESDQAAAAKLQDYLGKRGERLDQRAARLKDKSDNDVNMSLIDAGLAMMQSRGQGLAGIAEGASVGMKRYTDELRQNEAARQKIEEARDAYDDLKFNREDMSRKEILARQKEISDAHVALKKNNVDYMVAHEGMDRKTADHMYDSAMSFALEGQRQQYQSKENVLDRANRLQAAAAPLNAQLGLLTALGKAEPGSPIAKGFALQKLEAQEPAMFKNYIDLVSDPIKGDKFKAQYPDFSSYLADFNKRGGIAALQGSAGAAAPVVLPR